VRCRSGSGQRASDISGAVAAIVEAGGVPKRRARGSVLRGGGQGMHVRRHAGGEDWSGQ
jgi:hypothetical protein